MPSLKNPLDILKIAKEEGRLAEIEELHGPHHLKPLPTIYEMSELIKIVKYLLILFQIKF